MSTLREIPFEKETIFEGHILHVEKWQVTCPNGHAAPREIVVHNGAAAVVPVYEDGTTLLVRQHRVSVDRVTLEIPAGKLEAGETDRPAAARRELSEETGYTADTLIDLGKYFGCPALISEDINMYLATGLHPGECHPDEDEFLRVRTIPMAEAVEMVARGQIPDGKTQLGILRAKLWWEQNH